MTTKSKRRLKNEKNRKRDSRNDFLNARELKFVAAWAGNELEAAIAAGYSKRSAAGIGAELMKRPKIQQALREKQERIVAAAAEKDAEVVNKVARKGINRTAVIERAWELANLDPLATKFSIAGQVKALDLLADVLAMKKQPAENPFDGKTEEELGHFVKHGYFPDDKGKSGDVGGPGTSAEGTQPPALGGTQSTE